MWTSCGVTVASRRSDISLVATILILSCHIETKAMTVLIGVDWTVSRVAICRRDWTCSCRPPVYNIIRLGEELTGR